MQMAQANTEDSAMIRKQVSAFCAVVQSARVSFASRCCEHHQAVTIA